MLNIKRREPVIVAKVPKVVVTQLSTNLGMYMVTLSHASSALPVYL